MTTKPKALGGDQSGSVAAPGRHNQDRGPKPLAARHRPAADDGFASLHAEWAAIADRPAACRTVQTWAQRCPELGAFVSPAELVATIGRLGDPARSCTLLSDLLFLAADDALARRTVLQALLPGLRLAARHRWRRATVGPWRCERDAAHDALSAGWEAITALAGQRHCRPAAIVLRHVEGRLRRIHNSWQRETSRTTALTDSVVEPRHFGLDMARSPELQAAAIIADALYAEVLDHRQAAILFACGVIGDPPRLVEQTLGLVPGSGYRMLASARSAIRHWLTDEPDHLGTADPLFQSYHARSGHLIADRRPLENAPMPSLLLTPSQAAEMLGISRSKLYALMSVGDIESVTIGTSRRVAYRELVRYVESLPRHRPNRGPTKRLTLLHPEPVRESPKSYSTDSTSRQAR
jgi:excisionase family DNA binding protein